MVKINQVKITNKIIGSGLLGTVYLGKHKSKNYAVKIEKYSEKYKNEFDTETKFAKKVTENNYFMKIYDRKIIYPCNHNQTKPRWFNKINTNLRNKIKDLTKSKKCIITLCELIKGKPLAYYVDMFKFKHYYNVLIELYTAIKYIKSLGYIHGDLHLQNIICQKINNKFKCKIIDYGFVIHKSSKNELFKLAAQYDTNSVLFNLCMDMSKINYIVDKRSNISQDNFFKKIKHDKLFKLLQKENKKLSLDDLIFLYIIKYEKQYINLVLKKKYEENMIYYFIPKQHIYFLVKYGYDIDLCIKYLKQLYKKS